MATPETKPVPVTDLALDLKNFRTIPQQSELEAVSAMISTSPDRFWALTESLIADGYLPTDSIIVLKATSGTNGLTVKEGNRRIAAMKIVLGLLPISDLAMPDNIIAQIGTLTESWRKANERVPCTIYPASDAAMVDRIVTLAHGKGEKAGRDQWNAVARARHNRDANQAAEVGLDLLEKYLKDGKNITEDQKSRLAGNYPLSVLEEAMKKLAPRIGVATAAKLASTYPAVKNRAALESIML